MSAENPSLSLDGLVTSVAVRLMAANAATSVQVSEEVLAVLVDYFDADASFLRHHDLANRASLLVATWPVRSEALRADPPSVVYFADADPVAAFAEHAKTPTIVRDGSGGATAAAPLVSSDRTTGLLGVAKRGAGQWRPEEVTTLGAIASLFAQVQARVVAEERLRFLADHDDLTGLPNRRALVDHLDALLEGGRPGPVSALYIDLDRLKIINDYLGHDAGDSFICVLAQRLRESTEAASVIARLGGDEFVIVPASPTSSIDAKQLADQLLSVLSERVAVDGEMLARTVSIGVTTGSPGRDTTSDLLRRADQAVLAAKGAGGNQVAIFSDEMSLRTDYRNDIELHLHNVIENGSLFLQYLPEVDMRTGEVLATEALVRWNHPTRGLLSPAAFIAVAESINLAGELGRWVLRTACAEFAGWRARGIADDVVLRVNVSPVQLVTEGFVESVADVLNEFDLPPGSVCVEITESVVVQDMETTSVTLAELRDAGVQVAIDDFGTGFSVLSHLKALPVDALKIDHGFITDLGSNRGDLAIVRAVIALAEAFELELVAEGVESGLAAKTLIDHGCYRAQGFLLSRPLTAEEMAALLTEGRVAVDTSTPPTL